MLFCYRITIKLLLQVISILHKSDSDEEQNINMLKTLCDHQSKRFCHLNKEASELVFFTCDLGLKSVTDSSWVVFQQILSGCC